MIDIFDPSPIVDGFMQQDPRDPAVLRVPAFEPPYRLLGEGRDPVSVARARTAQRAERVQVLRNLYQNDPDGFDHVLGLMLPDDPDVYQGLTGRAFARASVRHHEWKQAKVQR
jgi:hypothetical protein